MKQIRLGTRGSELALKQADMTKQALLAAWPDLHVHIEIIKTTGDLRPDLKLAEFQKGPDPLDKGIFTKELEEALREGRVDVAVHSLKDVPTELAAGFSIAAVLPRAPIEDVLLSKHEGGIEGLPQGALVATSSVRRAKQLQWRRPDLRVEEIRGNVATRIEKLAANERLDATLLALAGLKRLGLDASQRVVAGKIIHLSTLSTATMLPAASQGAVGFEVYGDGPERDAILAKINHLPTFQCVQLERHFLHRLQAGCHTPVGIFTEMQGGGLRATAVVFAESTGHQPRQAQASGAAEEFETVADQLFAALV